jgi:hypothetical protein
MYIGTCKDYGFKSYVSRLPHFRIRLKENGDPLIHCLFFSFNFLQIFHMCRVSENRVLPKQDKCTLSTRPSKFIPEIEILYRGEDFLYLRMKFLRGCKAQLITI